MKLICALLLSIYCMIASADTVEFIAVGSGYYIVVHNGAQISQHVTERKALEALANIMLADPSASAFVLHDNYLVRAVVVITNPDPPVVPPGSGGDPGGFTVNWTAPTTRSDGSALPADQIGGYMLYYGTDAGIYSNVVEIADPAAVTTTVTDLAPGNYYLVMTTYDTVGRESVYSEEIMKVVQ